MGHLARPTLGCRGGDPVSGLCDTKPRPDFDSHANEPWRVLTGAATLVTRSCDQFSTGCARRRSRPPTDVLRASRSRYTPCHRRSPSSRWPAWCFFAGCARSTAPSTRASRDTLGVGGLCVCARAWTPPLSRTATFPRALASEPTTPQCAQRFASLVVGRWRNTDWRSSVLVITRVRASATPHAPRDLCWAGGERAGEAPGRHAAARLQARVRHVPAAQRAAS